MQKLLPRSRMLGYCWATVADGGPTLTQHWLNIKGRTFSEVHLRLFVSTNSPGALA